MTLQDFSLECIDGAVACVLQPSADEPTLLRVGRQVQGQSFWERLVLDERERMTISREHCQIRASPGELLLCNMSSVGTAVNGLAVHKEQPVRAGDIIGVGTRDPKGPLNPVIKFRVCIKNMDANSCEGASGLGEIFCKESWSLQCVSASGRQPSDIQRLAEEERVLRPLNGQSLRVGRKAQPLKFWETLVPDEASRNKISREHFEVQPAGSGWTLASLGAAGTLVNGKLIKESAPLRQGDMVEIPFSMRPEEQGAPIVSFCFQAPRCAAPPASATLLISLAPSSCQVCCVSVKGRLSSDVQAMPETARVLSMNGSGLKIGRSHQLKFWEALIPDEAVRNKVSREHFEIRADASASGLELVNIAASGTFHNGARVKDKAVLRLGDHVGVPSTAAMMGTTEEEPVASFEVQAAGSPACKVTPVPSLPDIGSGFTAAAFGLTGTPSGGYSGAQAYDRSASSGCGGGDRATASLPGREGLPVFELQVVSALGLSAVDLSFLPKDQRVWYPDVGARSFRIGRTVQPQSLWSALIPDERCRNSISRDHFEIIMEPGPSFFLTPSNNMAQTLINGQRVNNKTRLEPMDVIGIGSSPSDLKDPVVRFRFSLETGSVLASVTTLPNNRLAEANQPGWSS